MPLAREEIYYAVMYVGYKSRNASLSSNFRAPKFLIPGEFGVSE